MCESPAKAWFIGGHELTYPGISRSMMVFQWFHMVSSFFFAGESSSLVTGIPVDPMGSQGAETLEHVVSIIRVELAGSSSYRMRPPELPDENLGV